MHQEKEYFVWDPVKKTYNFNPVCPYCHHTITIMNNQTLIRCNNCNELLEVVGHEHEEGKIVYWPRTASDNFSTLDGHKYQHTSPFDWGEIGGSSNRNGFVIDPEHQLFGLPNIDTEFSLKKVWEHTLNDSYEHARSLRALPESLNVMHGVLYITYQDGRIDSFSNIQQSQPTKASSCTNEFHSVRPSLLYRFEPVFRFPYIFLTNGNEIVIWTLSFSSNKTKDFKRIPINPNNKNWTKSHHIIGSPTSFLHEGKIGFAYTMSNFSQKWSPSYLCVIFQDSESEEFQSKIIPLGRGIVRPVLYSEEKQAFYAISFEGAIISKLNVASIWDQDDIKFTEYRLSEVKICINQHAYHTVALRTNTENKLELFALARIQSNNNSETHFCFLNLEDLENDLESSKWKTVPLQIGNNASPIGEVYAMACGTNIPGKSNLDVANIVSVTTKDGVYNFTIDGYPTGGTLLFDTSRFITEQTRDATIISNAGLINRIGDNLQLYWGGMWSTSERVKHSADHSLTSYHYPGIALFQKRIFIVHNKVLEDQHYEQKIMVSAFEITRKDMRKD